MITALNERLAQALGYLGEGIENTLKHQVGTLRDGYGLSSLAILSVFAACLLSKFS